MNNFYDYSNMCKLSEDTFLKKVESKYQNIFSRVWIDSASNYFSNAEMTQKSVQPILEMIDKAPLDELFVLFATTTGLISVDENGNKTYSYAKFDLIAEALNLNSWSNKSNFPNFSIRPEHKTIFELTILMRMKDLLREGMPTQAQDVKPDGELSEKNDFQTAYYISVHALTFTGILNRLKELKSDINVLEELNYQLNKLLSSSNSTRSWHTITWLGNYVETALLFFSEKPSTATKETEKILEKIVFEKYYVDLHLNFDNQLHLVSLLALVKYGSSENKKRALLILTKYYYRAVEELSHESIVAYLPFTPAYMIALIKNNSNISQSFVEDWEKITSWAEVKNIKITNSPSYQKFL